MTIVKTKATRQRSKTTWRTVAKSTTTSHTQSKRPSTRSLICSQADCWSLTSSSVSIGWSLFTITILMASLQMRWDLERQSRPSVCLLTWSAIKVTKAHSWSLCPWSLFKTGSPSSKSGLHPSVSSPTKERKMKDPHLLNSSRMRSSMWCWQRMSTFWTTSQLCASLTGNTSWLMKVIAWETLSLSSPQHLVNSTNLNTDSCSLEHPCRTTWLSYGPCWTSYCQRFSHHVKSLKSGLKSRFPRCILWPTKQCRKMTSSITSSPKKNNCSLSTDCIRFYAHSYSDVSSVRSRKNFHPRVRWSSRSSYPTGRRLFTMAFLKEDWQEILLLAKSAIKVWETRWCNWERSLIIRISSWSVTPVTTLTGSLCRLVNLNCLTESCPRYCVWVTKCSSSLNSSSWYRSCANSSSIEGSSILN